jgi:DNA-binding GntR family transcriptional regulator
MIDHEGKLTYPLMTADPGNTLEENGLPRSEAVFRALRDDIVNLRITSADKLFESTVAERYQASRTPVREALQRLAADGLLVRRGRAYVPPTIDYDFVDNLYSVREALECKAMELFIARHASLEETRAPMEAMARAIETSNHEAFNRADIDFHSALARGSGNRLLEELLTTIWERVIYVRNVAFRNPERLQITLEEHRRIVEALDRGNRVIAIEEMRAHLRSVPELLIGNL